MSKTPILQPILGEKPRRPFITHHNALGDQYLRTPAGGKSRN